MTLAHGQYQTDMEKARDAVNAARLARIRLVRLFDLENIPASFLPWIAQTFDADMWPGAIGGESLQRLSIRDAIFIHKHRGTPAALYRFGDTVGAAITYTLNARVGSTPGSVDIYVNPPAGVADIEWIEYVTRVVSRLIPGWLTLSAVHILSAGRATVHKTVVGTPWTHQVFKGRITSS